MRAHRLRREIVATAAHEPARRPRRDRPRPAPARRHRARRSRTSRGRPRSRGRSTRSTPCGTTSRHSPTRSPPHRWPRCSSRRSGSRRAPRAGCCSTAGGRWTSRPTVEALGEDVRTVSGMLPALLHGAGREAFEERVAAWTSQGLPEALARRAAGLQPLAAALDVADVAAATGSPIGRAAGVYGLLGERLSLDWLYEIVTARGRNNRWEVQARTSLRDDLYVVRRTLTERVLREADGDDPDGARRRVAGRARRGRRPRARAARRRAPGAAPATPPRRPSRCARSARWRAERPRSATMRTSTPGASRSRRMGSGSPRRASPAAHRRRAEQDVGRAALARDHAPRPPRRRRPPRR